MESLRKGFDILEKYDNTKGDVSVGSYQDIYAGPQHDEPMQDGGVSPGDFNRLTALGWEYDGDNVHRWYYA